jgi:hypothetical protein
MCIIYKSADDFVNNVLFLVYFYAMITKKLGETKNNKLFTKSSTDL